MHHDPSFSNGFRQAVETELVAIEADPMFARAPVMRRLLRFLVTEALAGRGDKLKSYAIAVEALGRRPDFDAQTDSYPRVQVARLRKLIEAHYARTPPAGNVQIRMPSDGYAIEFADHTRDQAQPPADNAPSRMRPGRGWHWAALAAVAALAVAALVIALPKPVNGWRDNNFPVIHLARVVALDADAQQREAAIDLTNSLGVALDRFTAIDVVRAPSDAAVYRIDASLREVPDGTRINFILTRVETGRVVWSRSMLNPRIEGGVFDVEDVAASLSGWIAQPAGIIHSDGDQRDIAIDTPYGCWLALRSYWRMMPPEDEPVVRECVTAWAEHAPRSAMARGAISWFLAQDALKLSGDARARGLSAAYFEALKAVELQPNDPGAQYSRMRAALYLGRNREAAEVGERILLINGHNPEFMAGVGMYRVMMGDAAGEAVLNRALTLHANLPPWVHSGMFFAAVARDDPDAALAAAETFSAPPPTPMRDVMMAMAMARGGQTAQARDRWQAAVKAAPILAEDPETVLDPIPLSPAIRARSLAWMAAAAEAR